MGLRTTDQMIFARRLRAVADDLRRMADFIDSGGQPEHLGELEPPPCYISFSAQGVVFDDMVEQHEIDPIAWQIQQDLKKEGDA